MRIINLNVNDFKEFKPIENSKFLKGSEGNNGLGKILLFKQFNYQLENKIKAIKITLRNFK